MNSIKKACTPRKYINKILLYVTFVVLMILFISVFFFVKHSKEDRIAALSDHIVSNFNTGLDYEMADLLSFSLALSENGEIKNTLIADDESRGYSILNKITERFKKYTHLKSLHIQVLTPDFFIFARSWDEGFEGMPVWWFRDDLDELNQNQQPKVGMETGRLLSFKATIPIRSGDEVLGYLEVIKLIDEFATSLRKKGIELFVLMDEKYLEQAELMHDLPLVNGCVIANQNFNQQFLNTLKMLDWETFLTRGYLYEDSTLYLSVPMYNGIGKRIGIYLLAVSEEAFKEYEKENESISFFTQFTDNDIGKVVNAWKNPHGSFRSNYDKDIVGFLPKLKQEDKVELEAEAKKILHAYSKDELIDIVIENKHKEKKIGVIE